MSEVFQALPGSSLNKLMRFNVHGMASHEFQRALAQFYCSPGYEDSIDVLKEVDGRKFVDFLDKVRPSSRFRLNPCVDSRFRCYGPRG